MLRAKKNWLVVSTPLKNMLVKMGIFPNFRGENKKIFELPPPRKSLLKSQLILLDERSGIDLYDLRIILSEHTTDWDQKKYQSGQMIRFHQPKFP